MNNITKLALVGLATCVVIFGLGACGSAPTATTLLAQGLKAQLSGDLATAESSYQDAIKLDANNAVAHYDLGTVYDKQGNRSQAVVEYKASLVINPSFPDALFNLAVDTAGSAPVDAANLYLTVVKLQPNFAAAWLNLGFILRDQGKSDEASADWAKAISLDATLASRIPSTSVASAGHAPPTPTPAQKP